MNRRRFLLATTSAAAIGCLHDPPSPPMMVATSRPPRDREALNEFTRSRITAELLPNEQSSQFALITILGIVGFVLQVVQYCKAPNALRQQAAVKARPNGAVAKRLHLKLFAQYAKANPTEFTDETSAHMRAAVAAFGNATPAELQQLHEDLQRLNDSPTPLDLFNLSESLSI